MKNMNHSILDKNNQQQLRRLFTSVFTSSEGSQEGRLIGDLASQLAGGIDNQEIICFGTYLEKSIIAAIFFSRLRFSQDIQIYLLAPVAVSTEHQGTGIGQALIRYGLNDLKNRPVAVAITYGDPSFYSRIGFQALSETVIQAPLKLSMPQGWLGQSLTDEPIPVIDERPTCVKQFNDPVYW